MRETIKIAIAESSAVVRSGILAVLKKSHSSHFEALEISDISQLRHSLAWHKPDLLLINPSALGLFSLQQIRKEAPSLKCVALLHSLTDPAIIKEYDETLSIYDTPELIEEKVARVAGRPSPGVHRESLSAREKEVVSCVVKGMTNRQIADKLFLSTHTVITHRRNISNKLGIHSTAGLTIYAIVNKLVELGEVTDAAE